MKKPSRKAAVSHPAPLFRVALGGVLPTAPVLPPGLEPGELYIVKPGH